MRLLHSNVPSIRAVLLRKLSQLLSARGAPNIRRFSCRVATFTMPLALLPATTPAVTAAVRLLRAPPWPAQPCVHHTYGLGRARLRKNTNFKIVFFS